MQLLKEDEALLRSAAVTELVEAHIRYAQGKDFSPEPGSLADYICKLYQERRPKHPEAYRVNNLVVEAKPEAASFTSLAAVIQCAPAMKPQLADRALGLAKRVVSVWRDNGGPTLVLPKEVETTLSGLGDILQRASSRLTKVPDTDISVASCVEELRLVARGELFFPAIDQFELLEAGCSESDVWQDFLESLSRLIAPNAPLPLPDRKREKAAAIVELKISEFGYPLHALLERLWKLRLAVAREDRERELLARILAIAMAPHTELVKAIQFEPELFRKIGEILNAHEYVVWLLTVMFRTQLSYVAELTRQLVSRQPQRGVDYSRLQRMPEHLEDLAEKLDDKETVQLSPLLQELFSLMGVSKNIGAECLYF
jgi:hypothetical protein